MFRKLVVKILTKLGYEIYKIPFSPGVSNTEIHIKRGNISSLICSIPAIGTPYKHSFPLLGLDYEYSLLELIESVINIKCKENKRWKTIIKFF